MQWDKTTIHFWEQFFTLPKICWWIDQIENVKNWTQTAPDVSIFQEHFLCREWSTAFTLDSGRFFFKPSHYDPQGTDQITPGVQKTGLVFHVMIYLNLHWHCKLCKHENLRCWPSSGFVHGSNQSSCPFYVENHDQPINHQNLGGFHNIFRSTSPSI